MQQSAGFVQYENVHESYLRQRQLKGNANAYLLWAFGICIVIGGDFFGWNYGLAAGGFWGMFIATGLVAIMYVCLLYSVSELSTAFPHAGGFYSFTRSAFGPFWGFVCGTSVIIEYVLGAAATVVALSSYLKPLLPALPPLLIWFVAFVVFTAINIRGVGFALSVALYLALMAMMVLGVFYICTLIGGTFHLDLLFNIPPDPGQPQWLPKGLVGIFAAIPYAVWFFIGIEAIPLVAEETPNIPKSMPSAMTLGIFTLIIFALLTLVLNSGVGEGAVKVGQVAAPLGYGLEAYFSTGNAINIALLPGVMATFHGMMFAAGRAIYALSRSGYSPRWLSVTGKGNTPYRALIIGSILGFFCVALTDIGSDTVDAVIVNLSVFGGLVSYVLVMLSYVTLKLTRPELPRPYNSPLGIWGGIVGAVLAVIALIACSLVPGYQLGLVGLAIALSAAIVWFLFVGRHHLVAQAPEEATALMSEGRISGHSV